MSSDDAEAKLMDAVPAGSYLALSQAGADLLAGDAQRVITGIISSSGRQQYPCRAGEPVACLFGGADLVEPGPVGAEERPREPGAGDTGRSPCAAGRER